MWLLEQPYCAQMGFVMAILLYLVLVILTVKVFA
jgi:hypothetical protein